MDLNTKVVSMITKLLVLRVTYYRIEILQRLWRLKLLIFFVAAITIPTVAIFIQIIQMASSSLVIGTKNNVDFINLIIFQLMAMIWIGSQCDCLKLPDIENYLRTLRISSVKFFIVELSFVSIILTPLIIFLAIGLFSLAEKQLILLSIVNIIYLTTSLVFIAICLIFSSPVLLSVLIFTNLALVYFDQPIECLLLSTVVLALSYQVVKNNILSLKIKKILPIPQPNIAKFFPNISLNMKSLFLGKKIYTASIISLNFLTMLVFVNYGEKIFNIDQLKFGMLIMLGVITFFCSLLSYKITEVRSAYGGYFGMFYNQSNYYFFDLSSIFAIALVYYVIATIIGLYIGFGAFFIIKLVVIAMLNLLVFFAINRLFVFYGPIFSLLSLVTTLIFSRNLL